jgi:hypothetical protein
MKKKYLLVVKLEADICEHITAGDENIEKHLNALLRVFLKDPRLIREFYEHLIVTDVFNSMAAPDFSEKIKDEVAQLGKRDNREIIKKLLPELPGDSKRFFETNLENTQVFDHLMALFDDVFWNFSVTNLNFMAIDEEN